MEIQELQKALLDIANRIGNGEVKVAEAKSNYDNIEEQKKNILSELMLDSSESSVSKMEVKARASKEWREFISHLKDARHEYNKNNAFLKGLYAKKDIYITLLSFEKAKLDIR